MYMYMYIQHAHCAHACRSPGRIVETMIEDITEMNGGGLLTVIVQNTGSVSADYAVRTLYMYMYTSCTMFSAHEHVYTIFYTHNPYIQVGVDDCSEGIVRVAQQTQSLDPRQQGTFEWQISAAINAGLDHNCSGTDIKVGREIREF